eukprot:3199351-Prymnesium_polylepis.1
MSAVGWQDRYILGVGEARSKLLEGGVHVWAAHDVAHAERRRGLGLAFWWRREGMRGRGDG